MPELPEVETLLLSLREVILGSEISYIELKRDSLREAIILPNSIISQKVLNLYRRGKYLIVELKDYFWLIHLGMSGSIRVVEANQEIKKHDHIIVKFQGGKNKKEIEIRYHDPRRFGVWLTYSKSEYKNLDALEMQHKKLKNLGIEPFDFNVKMLKEICKKYPNRKIKPLIMDQNLVVGVGNIYACEALFLSKIHPERIAGSLSTEECRNLIQNIQNILKKSIEKGGTTLKDFVNAHGETGYFQQTLLIYGRKGKPCVSCDQTILSITQGSRSTFFCPKCQK